MIINAKTTAVVLLIIGVAFYWGLSVARTFALSIAQENHDANVALDMTEEAKRAKRERDADAAASAAFAKVEPLLPANILKSTTATTAAPQTQPQPQITSSAPSSGNISIDLEGQGQAKLPAEEAQHTV
ncbi:hypothetical protein THAOC_04138 [Thalassiosira oceanica]|uniref:Uncharacterized protein n=1 Tax=Thalassiosira oceanica TaxID=159749 RepID=K0T638_THAOC|nr:hypothetical protein THAOC_04138 [Thalassiosira oceanica]|mmetsp:Transcript_36055/g.85929  ORF Transcript_36055/g.85929 Transcript_36055/m.85929 type:complete len:129 (-) Transcript_36055:142-528(-)|eukprot:EJK74203.1 hypothetical protein THAOC_04138 [Thalassiosira oceanica]